MLQNVTTLRLSIHTPQAVNPPSLGSVDAESQHPHSPGWEGLQPPLCYMLYLHITGNYKDVNVIIE